MVLLSGENAALRDSSWGRGVGSGRFRPGRFGPPGRSALKFVPGRWIGMLARAGKKGHQSGTREGLRRAGADGLHEGRAGAGAAGSRADDGEREAGGAVLLDARAARAGASTVLQVRMSPSAISPHTSSMGGKSAER